MSNKPKTSKTNITKITANSNPETVETPKISPAPAPTETKPTKTKPQKSKKSPKDTAEKPLKEVFILARPFVAFGRYLRDSWREIRQVRWPNRKLTWKMTLAVLIYCAIFMIFILVLDALFTFIFNLLLGIN
jgi:preprotein translocase SecE subunit